METVTWQFWRHNAGTPLPANDCRFSDHQFLDETDAIIRFRGHEKGEADFRPDWGRFWRLEHDNWDESDNGMTVTVVYSSNEILAELRQWLPCGNTHYRA